MVKRSRQLASEVKGRLLEDVVARLQEAEVGHVSTRVKLPSRQDPTRTPREIDVLVSVPWGLKPLQVPFECRNLARKIGPRDIGEFRDKLDEVGLPVPYGIFVTTTGYTSGAIKRAQDLGIQTLLFRGLTTDRLRVAVRNARHSTVVLVLRVHALHPLDHVTGQGQQFENPMPAAAFDEPLEAPAEGDLRMEHLLWRLADLWCLGGIPRALGVHGGAFRVPDGFQLPDMEPIHSGLIWCNLRVSGIVFPLEGSVEALELHDASSGESRQQRLDWRFPSEFAGKSELIFETEEELVKYLQEQQVSFHLVTRIIVPRVQFLAFWWPLSPEALRRAKQVRDDGQVPSFESVECASLTRGWAEDPRRLRHTGEADNS